MEKQATVGFDIYSNPGFVPKSSSDDGYEDEEYEYDSGGIQAAIDKSNDESVYLNNGTPINSEVSLAEAYRNYANSIVCRFNNVILPPWNEYSSYEDVAKFCYNNKTAQQLHELELLEDRCISMGLDPTGGGLKIPPGTRLLSSIHRPYFVNGQPIPEAFQYDEEREKMESFQKTGQFNARPVYQDINQVSFSPFPQQQVAMFDDYTYEYNMTVGKPIQHNYQTVLFKQEPLPIETTAVLPNRFQEYVYIPEMPVDPPKDNSPEELKAYQNRLYAETHKQEIYDAVADLTIERQKLIQQLHSPWLNDRRVVNDINKQLTKIDQELTETASKSKQYPSQEAFNQEIDMLKTNYEIRKRNERLYNFEQRQTAKSNLRRHPDLVDSVDMLDFRGQPVQKEWYSEYGSLIFGQNADVFARALSKRKEIETFAENFDRRQAMIKFQNFTLECAAMVDEYEGNATFEEAYYYYKEHDTFGFNEVLKQPQFRTRASILEEEALREKPEDFPDYVPRFGKREKDLTDKEKRLLMWGKKRLQMQAQAEFEAAHPEVLRERVLLIDPRRAPLTAALIDAQNSTETDNKKRLEIFANAVNDGMAKAEAIKPPSNLERMYDHRGFNETLQNYGLKTKIGSLSDLLAEYDTNDSFKEAMNKGFINIGTPEEIGIAYNKDRVEFDNSIIEQYKAVNRPLPENDPDAHIKDPYNDPYHSTMTIEEITKEEYENALGYSQEYTMFISPELGGTYDATQQHPTG